MGYEGLRGVTSPVNPGLGGNVHQGDPFSFSPRVWTYLVHRFGVKSVLDVGCGEGHAAKYFSSVLGCITLAMDGLRENLDGAVYPIIVHDLRKVAFVTKVDLVHCVEVAEHLEAEFVDNLFMTFSAGRVLSMTHAVPGQDGHHHVNCQSTDYWRDNAARFGFSLAAEDTRRVRELAEQDGALHFQKTGLVFTKV